MKRVLIPEAEEKDKVHLASISEDTPIFAKKLGRYAGMLVREDVGWIIMIGPKIGATGYHPTREKCLRSALEYGYMFYVED